MTALSPPSSRALLKVFIRSTVFLVRLSPDLHENEKKLWGKPTQLCVPSDERARQSRLKKTETTKEMSRSATVDSILIPDWADFTHVCVALSFEDMCFKHVSKFAETGFASLLSLSITASLQVHFPSIRFRFWLRKMNVCVFIREKWETFIKSYPLLRTRSVLTNHIWYTL